MEQRTNIALWAYFFAFLPIFFTSVGATTPRNEIHLNWNLSPTEKAGSKKSGLACLPNGSLRWQDIAKPEPDLIQAKLRPLLATSAIPNASAKGDLTSLKAMICSPWLGIGAQPKSEIKLSVKWTLVAGDRHLREIVTHSSVSRRQFDLRSSPDLLIEAIEAGLQDAIRQF